MKTRTVHLFVQPRSGQVELGVIGIDMLVQTLQEPTTIAFATQEDVRKALRGADLSEAFAEFGRHEEVVVTAAQLRQLGFTVDGD